MDDLKIGTIIKMADQKNYYVFDTITVNQKNYALMAPEEETEGQEEIFILKDNIDEQGKRYFTSINNREMITVLENLYSVYQDAGVIEKGKINTQKYIKFIEDDSFADAIKQKYEIDNLKANIEKKDKKLEKAKDLLIENKDAINSYSNKIEELKANNQNLEEYNKMLNETISGLPKIVRKIFIKNDKKLLK